MNEPLRVFSQSDVERLLDVRSCIAAVESAFRQRGEGRLSPSGVLGLQVTGGGFHTKAAVLELSRPYFAAKVNANFPANPSMRGLPTIQGLLVLFDATNGVPLAVMDSIAITTLRTAAASAVAAKHLARKDGRTATFVGCGVQARAHLAAIAAVCNLDRVFVFDLYQRKAVQFANQSKAIYGFDIQVADDLRQATRISDIVVTVTSSTRPIISMGHLAPGAFVAAVGADNEHKQEIEAAVLGRGVIVVDDLEQCATIGDLHHAIEAGVVTRDDVRATLGEVVAGVKQGRLNDEETIVFDSTGVAIEDVAAAAIVFERALSENTGPPIRE